MLYDFWLYKFYAGIHWVPRIWSVKQENCIHSWHLQLTQVDEINYTLSSHTFNVERKQKMTSGTWGVNGLQLHNYRAGLPALLIFLFYTPLLLWTAKIWGVSFGVDPRCWGLQRGIIAAPKLFSTYTNLSEHSTSTSLRHIEKRLAKAIPSYVLGTLPIVHPNPSESITTLPSMEFSVRWKRSTSPFVVGW